MELRAGLAGGAVLSLRKKNNLKCALKRLSNVHTYLTTAPHWCAS